MAGSVGVVYDPLFLEHESPGHPERPERLAAVVAELERCGLLARLEPVPARAASADELGRAHAAAHVERVREVAGRSGFLDGDTFTSEGSWQAAICAAGGTADLVLRVARGELARGLALTRPPGHHATVERAMGFCLFNNVAVAVRAAQAAGAVRRVAIVDFDVHHGNGTQDIFWHDGDVLFASTHQHPLYPGTGGVEENGAGAGRGATLNLPLPAGTGDDGMTAVYEAVVLPALRRFAPDLLVISAGYDGHWRDPLAGHLLTLEGYAGLARDLVAVAGESCGGRVVAVLEGGYDLAVLAHGVADLARILLGERAAADPLGPDPLGAARVADAELAPLLARAADLAAAVPRP